MLHAGYDCLPHLRAFRWSDAVSLTTDFRFLPCSSKTGGSLGGDSSNAGRDLSSGISSAASAMLEEATKLAQNCQIPLVSEAATLMSLIVKLVSDSRDNIRGIEKRLARCRSVITLLGNATKVIGKVRGMLRDQWSLLKL